MNDPQQLPPAPSDEIDLADLVTFLVGSWKWILGTGLVAAGAVAGVTIASPRSWESSALMLINNPEHAVMFTPIPVQGYQRIIESGEVVGQVREHALAERLADEQSARDLVIDRDLKTAFAVSKRDETATSPLIELKVTAKDPKIAAAIANYWAERSIAKVGDILTMSYLPQIEQADKAYLDAMAKLTAKREQVDAALTKWRTLSFPTSDKSKASSNDENVSISIPNSGLTEVGSYLDPELVSAKNLVLSLQQSHLEATQARVQFSRPALSIASPAVESAVPVERKTVQKTAIALVAGAFLGLLISGIRQILRNKREPRSAGVA